MKTKIILNPNAGQGYGAKVLPDIERICTASNVEYSLEQTTGPRDAIQMAAQAAADGFERVIAAGGDGTVHEVVNGLMAAQADGHSAVLGIIPVGSGNDLAFALGIPADVEKACAILRHGAPRAVDIGKVTVDGEPQFFGNNVGIGFDGEVVVDLQNGRSLQGFLMYLWSVFRVLFNGRWPFEIASTVDGVTTQHTVTLITVANGTRTGGGFLLTPAAKQDDGLLDICYAGKLSKLGVLNLLPRTINGSHVRQKSVTIATTKNISIRVPAGSPAHIDGEVLTADGHLFDIEILPLALHVWTPTEA